MKIIIIGNGIIGLTAAFELVNQNENTEIVILGRSDRVGSGSLAAGAMLNSFAEVDSETFSSEIERDRFRMSMKATELWPNFFRRIFNSYLELNITDKSIEDSFFLEKIKINSRL